MISRHAFLISRQKYKKKDLKTGLTAYKRYVILYMLLAKTNMIRGSYTASK